MHTEITVDSGEFYLLLTTLFTHLEIFEIYNKLVVVEISLHIYAKQLAKILITTFNS